MPNKAHYSFSAPGYYSLKVFGGLPLMNAQWINATNLKLHKKEGNGNTYLLKEAFKDQAHLIGFMQQVYENRFCII
jgi:hypothetical protein